MLVYARGKVSDGFTGRAGITASTKRLANNLRMEVFHIEHIYCLER